MRAALLFTAFALGAASVAAAELTATEMRWLRGGWPVVNYAKAQALPLDIVAQPQAKAGDAPLAMGFVEGRCKLVLAMRGNPEAESTLAQIPPALLDPVVEAMFAHELGHCWRYVHGAWHTLPAGFVEMADDGMVDDQEIARLRRDMRQTRREEGFADLVGLAWTLEHHPAEYLAVHRWFEQVRADQPVEGAHHDTRVWLRLAQDRSAFGAGETPFERARSLWRQGLESLP
ncbi:MAG TPA: hypothetical protein VF169_04010 [Albitalea sp.]|uniref:hypothetical protein n=1 Tax=Piscinibacter sp. TaxID=1903157 RepID=UPI002ED2C83D